MPFRTRLTAPALGLFAALIAPGPAFTGTAQADGDLKVHSSLRYYGVCDGSAAVRLGDRSVLVAHDEGNQLFVYDIWGGHPVAERDLADLLDLPGDREIDIEGVARHGDVLWWIGSHGLNKNARDRPNRRSLFATNVPNRLLSDLQVRVRRIDLLPVLLASDEMAAILGDEVLQRAPKEGGLNVEGLAAHPEGGLMLGLRAPLSEGLKGDAFAVHLAPDGAGFAVRSVHRLDLEDRGIRDLVRHGDGYHLIAGDVDSGGKFALYRWNDGDEPEKVTSRLLRRLNPEALVPLDDQWLVLSDDGSEARGEVDNDGDTPDCKDVMDDEPGTADSDVYFRSRIIGE